MKLRSTLGLLSGMALLATGCNNIDRDRPDVSTTAATMSTDTLETTELSVIDTEENLLREDTIINPSEPAVAQEPDETYTETEIVQVDTVSTRIVYDVRRRTIEEVDTVGATMTYEVRKKVLKRTVMIDTLTETEDEEQTVAYQKGNFEKLDEQVETDTIVEIIGYQEAKQKAAQARVKAASQQPEPQQPAARQQPAPRQEVTNPSNQPTSSPTEPTSAPNQPDSEATVNSPNQDQGASSTTQPTSTPNRPDTTTTSSQQQSTAPPPNDNATTTEERPLSPNIIRLDTTQQSDSGSR